MQRPATDIVSLSSWWGKEEQTTFVYIPLMTGTEVSYNSRILIFEDNPTSGIQAYGNGNMSSSLSDLEPRSVSHFGIINLGLGRDSRSPVPEIATE